MKFQEVYYFLFSGRSKNFFTKQSFQKKSFEMIV